MPDDLSPEAVTVDAARVHSEKHPGPYLAALVAFAATRGVWVRVPSPSGGRWLGPREAREARGAA